jgi:hypothetical protein
MTNRRLNKTMKMCDWECEPPGEPPMKYNLRSARREPRPPTRQFSEELLMPARLAQQDNENLQTSQVFETCEVSGTTIF